LYRPRVSSSIQLLAVVGGGAAERSQYHPMRGVTRDRRMARRNPDLGAGIKHLRLTKCLTDSRGRSEGAEICP
jgi:hypothetical protein